MTLFSSSEEIAEIADLETFSVGTWNQTFPLYSYMPENSIQIRKGEDGEKYIQVTFTNLVDYSGFGVLYNQPVPKEASLVFQIQSAQKIETLQADITDGSPNPPEKNGGEHFSYYFSLEPGKLQTFTIPLKKFERNAYQPASNPNDGVLDTQPIRKVEFVFTPGESNQFSVKRIYFTWKSTKWHKIVAFLFCVVFGTILFWVIPGGEIFPRQENILFPDSILIATVYFLTGISIIFLLLNNYSDWFLLHNFLFFSFFFLLMIGDVFFHPSDKFAYVWVFRYLIVFFLGNILSIPMAPLPYFLIFLAASVSVMQQRSRTFLFVIPLLGIIGLSMNAHIQDKSMFLYMVSLIAIGVFIAFFVHSILLHNFLSARMGNLTFLYEGLFENTTDAIYTVDENRVIRNVNNGFVILLGLKKEQILHKPLVDFVHPEDRHRLPTKSDFDLDKNQKYDLRFIHQSGTIHFTSVSECLMRQGNSVTGFQAIAHDITQRIEYENTIEHAKETAECANQSKSQFLATMSHELRTPLNSIIGFANILRKNKHNSLSSKELMFLEKIHESGLFLLQLINDLLDLSKIEAGKMQITPVPVFLPELIHETIQPFKLQTAGKEIQWESDCPLFDEPMYTDQEKLQQILNNLIGNAVKFTSRGKISVHVQKEKKGESQESILFQVIDTGIGIEKSKHELIFDTFTQADGSSSRKYPGTGLGLSISKQLIHLLGGEIGVVSELGKGSTFWFVLPRKTYWKREKPSDGGSAD